MSGFTAGTLVHTDKGLVPIQNIKVGDMVLSIPETGIGEKTYKPVLRTIHTPEKEVYRCTYWARNQYDEFEAEISYVLATAEHPIWSISEERWCSAKGINTGDKVFTLANDDQYHFLRANQVFQTQDEENNIYGFCYKSLFREDGDIGTYFNISAESIIIYDSEFGAKFSPHNNIIPSIALEIQLSGPADSTLLLGDVYNIEVVENHTYFVGEKGLWVHDANLIKIISNQALKI